MKELRSLLIESFDLEELHSLCFDLGINFDSLAGSTIDSKARELIATCQRQNRLPALLAACHQQRPHVAWPDLPAQTAAPSTTPQSHLHTYLTNKIETLQQQINLLYPLDEAPTPEAQLLLEAIKIVHKGDEVLFVNLIAFYHEVSATLRAWANPIGLTQPPFTCITFVDLADGSEAVIAKIEQMRLAAPTAVFILYTTPTEYEQCLQTAPPEWATRFGHYYKLLKKDGLQLAADIRKILDEARVTAVRKMEMQIIQAQL